MSPFNADIAELTQRNSDFRRVLLTNAHTQLALMSLEVGEEIGEETHDVDQILVFVSGEGEADLDGERFRVGANSLVCVPAGTRHNFVNTGGSALKLYTIYSPPEEPSGTLHRTKAEAQAAEAH